MHGSEPDWHSPEGSGEPATAGKLQAGAERTNAQGKDKKTGIMKTGISTENGTTMIRTEPAMADVIAKILKFIGVLLDRSDADQQFRGMKPSSVRLFAVLIACTFALQARATFLPGTIPVAPGQTVVPGLVTQGQSPGIFLTSQIIPEPSFTLTSAVFLNPTGTLDFYYQLTNGAHGSTITSLLIQSFDNAQTAVGYRFDAFPPFVPGAAIPTLGSRTSDGTDITLNFSLAAGFTGNLLVISTDAIALTNGRAFVTNPQPFGPIPTFAIATPTTVPDTGETLMLLATGLVGVFAARFLAQRVTN